MTAMKDFKKIKILSTSPYIPYYRICRDLVSDNKLQKEFRAIKFKTYCTPLPKNLNDEELLLKVASFFGVTLFFNKIKEDDVRGYCWPFKKEIQITLNEEDKNFNKRTLTHELGHILQIKHGLNKESDDFYLSEELKLEQQAETISYYLCRILWPKDKFVKSTFTSYFKEEDIIWLDEFYSSIKGINYINDVFVLND